MFFSIGFSGWLDRISNFSQGLYTANTTSLSIEEGQSLILECNPTTNDPSISNASVDWTRDDSRIVPGDNDDDIVFLQGGSSLLLVRNFRVPLGKESVTFECSLRGLGYFTGLRRTFVVTTSQGQ